MKDGQAWADGELEAVARRVVVLPARGLRAKHELPGQAREHGPMRAPRLQRQFREERRRLHRRCRRIGFRNEQLLPPVRRHPVADNPVHLVYPGLLVRAGFVQGVEFGVVGVARE